MKLHTFARAPLALAALSLSLLVLWGCPPKPVPPQPQTVSDTVAYWKFDGTPLDFSHHGHTAVPHGTIHYTEDIYGRRGMGLYLDGHGFLTVPDSVDLHITKKSSYTVVTWVRTYDSSKVPIMSWNSASGHAKLEFTLSAGKPNVVISAVPQILDLKGSVAVNDGHWHMLTLTVASPNTVDIYVDSTLVAHSATGALMPTDSAIGLLYIGATSDTMTRAKSAQFDEFLILNKSRNAAQVKSLMTDGGIPTGPPIGVCNPSTGKLYTVSTDGFHDIWVNNSLNWSSTSNGYNLHAIDYSNASTALVVGYKKIEYVNETSGLTVTDITNLSTLLSAYPDFNLMDVKVLSPTMALAVGGTFNLTTSAPLVVLLTTSTPNNWMSPAIGYRIPLTATAMFESITVAPDSSIWIVGKDGQIFRSDYPYNGVLNWIQKTAPVAQPSAPLQWFRGIDFMPVSGWPMKGLLVTDDGYGYEINVATNGTVTFTQPVYTGGRSFWTARCSQTSMYAGATGTNPNPNASATTVEPAYSNNTNGLYINWVGQTDAGSMPVNGWFSSARSLPQTGVYLAETRNRRVILR